VGSGILDCCYSQTVGDISRCTVYLVPYDAGYSLLGWQEFIPIKTLQALSRHGIGTIGAFVVFWVTTSIAALLFPQYEYIIGRIEIVGLVLLLVVLLYRLLKDRLMGGSNVPILAA
jgi:hypothetical protein